MTIKVWVKREELVDYVLSKAKEGYIVDIRFYPEWVSKAIRVLGYLPLTLPLTLFLLRRFKYRDRVLVVLTPKGESHGDMS